MIRHLWRFRPRPFWQPWRWSSRYYAWRLETYTGMPMHEVRWRTLMTLLRDPIHRHALIRYLRWVGQMQRLRRL